VAGLEVLTAGAAGIDPLVRDIGLCVLLAGTLSVLFERLRIPTIAALLVAGLAIGPSGFSLVTDRARIETIAHLGLTLLLFVIGLEVNVRGLLASGRKILISGGLQVPITIGVGWIAFYGLWRSGLGGALGTYGVLYLAIACGFSSTLLVVKQLQTKFQLDSPSGRLAVVLLIFQDIWAIVILALQPNFTKPDPWPVVATFAGIVTVALVGAFFARFVLPRAFHVVAKIPELIVTIALAWCFGLGLFGAHLGDLLARLGLHVEISVSLEMAALIAGASVASLPYSHELVSKVTNLRDFFVTLFFVALGMGIPIPRGLEVIVLAVVLAAIAMILRALVFVPLLYVAGFDRRTSVATSTRLAQVSEFCLVIAYLGVSLGHISAERASIVIFAFVLTALATPGLFAVADRLDGILAPVLERLGMRAPTSESDAGAGGHLKPRVVLLGFHRLASSLLHDLHRSQPELCRQTVVVDFNVALHDEIRKTGAHVLYGDIANAETLRHAGIEHAAIVISTVPDDILKGTSNLALARELRRLAPHATVIVNAIRISEAAAMYDAGADHVFAWRTETSRAVLDALEAILNGGLEDFRDARRRSGHELIGRHEILD
jgi:Kef-type K+ transport system membrane component KefB/voltage-gated potassium channel Kch